MNFTAMAWVAKSWLYYCLWCNVVQSYELTKIELFRSCKWPSSAKFLPSITQSHLNICMIWIQLAKLINLNQNWIELNLITDNFNAELKEILSTLMVLVDNRDLFDNMKYTNHMCIISNWKGEKMRKIYNKRSLLVQTLTELQLSSTSIQTNYLWC